MRAGLRCLVAVALLGCSARDDDNELPGHVLDISADEYAFTAPDSVPAGVVTLRLTQRGDAVLPWPGDSAHRVQDPTYDLHMAWVVRLDSARTVNDLLQAELDSAPTPWAVIVGGVGFADPPATANATLRLEPGNYALVCFVGSAREDRSRYHLLKGMVRSLVVTAATDSAALPATDVVVVLTGDSVEVADTIPAGRHRILVRNEGERRADFGVRSIPAGVTMEEVNAWRPRFMIAPPFASLGGVIAIPPGGSLITTLTLEPGDHIINRRHIVVQ